MREHDIHRSKRKILLIGISIFLFVVASFGTLVTAQPSIDTSPTGVQYDAVIEFNSSTRATHVLLFARYWVGPDYYDVSVIWGEPHGSGLSFCTYPITLRIASSNEGFSLGHDIYDDYNLTYPKPFESRGVFRNMYGDYPIPDIRFADQEAEAQRIYASDIWPLIDANESVSGMLDVSLHSGDNRGQRSISSVKVNTNSGQIDALELLDPNGLVLKDIHYNYDIVDGRSRLRSETVKLPEQPIIVGYRGKGLVVRIEGEEYSFRDFESVHHVGGRTATVEFATVSLGNRDVQLPSLVRVVDAEEQLLRSARMMNFTPIDMDAAEAREAAEEFGGFTPDHQAYRRFLIKYWEKDPADVNDTDRATIERLRAHFGQTASNTTRSLGETLRDLNILMELNRILGDSAQLEQRFVEYLSVLHDSDCKDMLLLGGTGAIDTLMSWGRYADADRLLERWLDAALASHAPASIQQFAQAHLRRGRPWIASLLLKRSLETQDWGSDQFAGQALRCEALCLLCDMSRNPDIAKTILAQAQTRWAQRSLGDTDTMEILQGALAKAKQTFADIETPSDEQIALETQLEALEEALTTPQSEIAPQDSAN